MYNVYRHYQDGTKQFLGQVDCPTEVMDLLYPHLLRVNHSYLIIEPN
jgi:hypothetical protein